MLPSRGADQAPYDSNWVPVPVSPCTTNAVSNAAHAIIIELPASGPVQVQPDLTHLAFEVDSLEEFGKHLARLGLKYSDGPHVKPDGGGIAFIDAPEGYEIELIQMAKTGAGY